MNSSSSSYRSDIDQWLFLASADINSGSSQAFIDRRTREDGFLEYRCALCWKEHIYVTSQELAQHNQQNSAHKHLIEELRKQQNRMMQELGEFRTLSRMIQPRIEKLGCMKWQNHIRTELLLQFHTITSFSSSDTTMTATNDNNMPSTTTSQQEQQAGSSLDHIYRLVGKYEYMERICLLELAIWKAACIMQLDENEEQEQGNNDDNKEHAAEPKVNKRRKQLLDVLEWMNHGWKSLKVKTRRSNSIEVIMLTVLPFLK